MKKILAYALVSLLILSTAAVAQVTQEESIRGVVRDEHGAVLPGVTMTATSSSAPRPVTAVSDADGVYRLQNLLPGTYVIVAELQGFSRYERAAIGSHGQQHGLGSHWEVWAAAFAMEPMGALEVATLHGATFLGLERQLGSLTVGKLADVIVLTKNPLDDIRNTTSLRYVVKNGTVWDASTLDQVWPVAKPYGDYPWVNPDALRSDDRPIGR